MDDGDHISPRSLKRAYSSLRLSRGHSSTSPSPLVKRSRLDKAQSVGEPMQSPNVQKKEEEVEVKEVEVNAVESEESSSDEFVDAEEWSISTCSLEGSRSLIFTR
jgi:hypothetical protein